MRLELTHIAPAQAAKLVSLAAFAFAVIQVLFALGVSNIKISGINVNSSAALGSWLLYIAPFLSALLAYISTFVACVIYNLAVNYLGGIRYEVRELSELQHHEPPPNE